MVDKGTMRFRLFLFTLLLLLGNRASAKPCSEVRAKPDAWVLTAIDTLIPAALTVFQDDTKLPAYQKELDRITGTMRRCGLVRDPAFVARHRNFVDYLNAISLERQPGHELGFTVPDWQYFAETRRFVQIPDFLLTTKFLRAVSRSETVDQAKAMLREMNTRRRVDQQMIFFTYSSRHLGTPDNDDSFRRLLIVLPGDPALRTPDQWVQFGITDPGARELIRNVSIVTAVANDDGTYTPYFKDFFRTYRRNGSITIKGRWELGEGDDNCATCHKSGVLPIFPVAGTVSPEEEPAVEAVNKIFRGYGSPRFGKYLDPAKFGPGLSEATPASRVARFGAGFADSTIGGAMSCTVCHNRAGLGSFNWPMDETLIASFVEGGQMPRGHALADQERTELYERLVQEYFDIDPMHPGILKAWLLGKELDAK